MRQKAEDWMERSAKCDGWSRSWFEEGGKILRKGAQRTVFSRGPSKKRTFQLRRDVFYIEAE